ncbi:hypothetical protein [Fusobacterium perfoetens]|uniref:hypothetical protein n=1 Tax=Fusobacterium perfoetens TaxID=852 RepID=UPI001F484672|nr:hypothetical protein [Fusobacterium perfoetens]MCF2611797.1 hypothetical protein [Fusobacterium perfoetens]
MWQCKECGSTDFIIEVTEEIRRQGKLNKKGNVEIEEFIDTKPQYSKSITYECNNCGDYSSRDIRDIADWVEEK